MPFELQKFNIHFDNTVFKFEENGERSKFFKIAHNRWIVINTYIIYIELADHIGKRCLFFRCYILICLKNELAGGTRSSRFSGRVKSVGRC